MKISRSIAISADVVLILAVAVTLFGSSVVAGCGQLSTTSTAPPSAKSTTDEMVQILVQGSPWSGPWKVLNPGPNLRFREGTAVVVFEQKDGRLTGRLVETTCGSCPIGDLTLVKVKNGRLEYRTPTGIDFTMTYRPDGNLEGQGSRPGERQVTKVLLCRSGKACPKEVEP